jgi:hypothetical protein
LWINVVKWKNIIYLVTSTEDIMPDFAAGLTVEIIRFFFFAHSFLPCPRLYWVKINTSNEVDHLPNMEYVIKPRIPYNLMNCVSFRSISEKKLFGEKLPIASYKILCYKLWQFNDISAHYRIDNR